MESARRLKGKVAWISGATSGIGQAVAELFAAQGAQVALAGRRENLGQPIARRINARHQRKTECGRALFTACDVAREEQVCASIQATIAEFGSLDILINNAGMVDVRDLHEYNEEQFDLVMAVNVKSIFFAVKHAFPHLRRQKRSYVVNVGSISSFVAQLGTPVYTASKGAVLQLSKSIAVDYARYGLRCNCVCPGITDTPMLREHLNKTPDPEATLRQRLGRVPMNVALSPLDVARTIIYLSCEDSAGVTGTSVIVDCGYLAAAEWDADYARELMK